MFSIKRGSASKRHRMPIMARSEERDRKRVGYYILDLTAALPEYTAANVIK